MAVPKGYSLAEKFAIVGVLETITIGSLLVFVSTSTSWSRWMSVRSDPEQWLDHHLGELSSLKPYGISLGFHWDFMGCIQSWDFGYGYCYSIYISMGFHFGFITTQHLCGRRRLAPRTEQVSSAKGSDSAASECQPLRSLPVPCRNGGLKFGRSGGPRIF